MNDMTNHGLIELGQALEYARSFGKSNIMYIKVSRNTAESTNIRDNI